MNRSQGVAEALAQAAFPTDEELVDIVVTGLEGGYPWFMVDQYRTSNGDGTSASPWAVVVEDISGEGWSAPDSEIEARERYKLTRGTVRTGVELFIEDRLLGHPPSEVLSRLEDYDLNDADAILQFATWGELRYG